MGKRGPPGKYTGRSKGRKASSNPANQLQIFQGSIDDRDHLAVDDDSVATASQQPRPRPADATIGDDWTTTRSATNSLSEHDGQPSEDEMTLPVGVGGKLLGETWDELVGDLDDFDQEGDLDTLAAGQTNGKSSSPFTLRERRHPKQSEKTGNTVRETFEQSQQTMMFSFSEPSDSDDPSLLHDDQDLDDLFQLPSSSEPDEDPRSGDKKFKRQRAVKAQPERAAKGAEEKPPGIIKKQKKKAPAIKSSKSSASTAKAQKKTPMAKAPYGQISMEESHLKKQPQQLGLARSRPPPQPKRSAMASSQPPQRKRRKQIAKTSFCASKNEIAPRVAKNLGTSNDREHEGGLETQRVGNNNDISIKTDVDTKFWPLPKDDKSPTLPTMGLEHTLPCMNDLPRVGSDQTDHVLDLNVFDPPVSIPEFPVTPAGDETRHDLASDFSMMDDFNDDDFIQLVTGLRPSPQPEITQTNLDGVNIDRTVGASHADKLPKANVISKPKKRKQDTEPAVCTHQPAETGHQVNWSKRPCLIGSQVSSGANLESQRQQIPDTNTLLASKDMVNLIQSPEAALVELSLGPISISSDDSSALSADSSANAEPSLPLHSPGPKSPASLTPPVLFAPGKLSKRNSSSPRGHTADHERLAKTQFIGFDADGPIDSGQHQTIQTDLMDGEHPETTDVGKAAANIVAGNQDAPVGRPAIVQHTSLVEPSQMGIASPSISSLSKKPLVTQTCFDFTRSRQEMPQSPRPRNINSIAQIPPNDQDLQENRCHTIQPDYLDAEPQARPAFTEGVRQLRRRPPRKRSIVDERGSPNPEGSGSLNNMVQKQEGLERPKSLPREPPTWNLPRARASRAKAANRVGTIQQEPLASHLTVIQAGNGSPEVERSRQPPHMLKNNILHGHKAGRSGLVGCLKSTGNHQEPQALAMLAQHSTEAYEQGAHQIDLSVNKQELGAIECREAFKYQQGFNVALGSGASGRHNHARQDLINHLHASDPPKESESAFDGRQKLPGITSERKIYDGSIVQNNPVSLQHGQIRIPSSSPNSFPTAVNNIVRNLLDQLEATKPSVTRVADLYWDNGHQALDKMEQVHRIERQSMTLSFDSHRLTYIERCQKTRTMITDLTKDVKGISAAQARNRSEQETKKTLEALKQLKETVGDVSAAI